MNVPLPESGISERRAPMFDKAGQVFKQICFKICEEKRSNLWKEKIDRQSRTDKVEQVFKQIGFKICEEKRSNLWKEKMRSQKNFPVKLLFTKCPPRNVQIRIVHQPAKSVQCSVRKFAGSTVHCQIVSSALARSGSRI